MRRYGYVSGSKRVQIECWALPAFVLALLFGGDVRPSPNPNEPGDLTAFDDDSLHLIVDEGRAQIAAQNDRFRHATDRAQLMVTVDLALLGFLAALLHQVLGVHGDRKWWALGVWCAAALLAVTGTAAAAAVMAVKATFSGIDTTQITTWESPVLRELAGDYAKAVRVGEMTVALRVTVFRQATRVSVLAAFVGAVAFGLSA